MIIQISLHKTADIWTEKDITTTKNISETIDILNNSVVDTLLSVTWKVVENAPVSVDKQNKTMLKRANKIADAIGRTVVSFDQIDNVKFGCVLV